ncbi:MAG TPA: hypothetical protein VGR08_11465, partial [Thermomicrobiales bacterium]|nr:hypothetical protein [Thermomicrobiales bacterium]
MRDFQTSRRPTVVTVLTSSGSAFFWGVSVAVVLKANVPRRVLALYRSQVGVPGQNAGAGDQASVQSGRGDGAPAAQASGERERAFGSGRDVAGTGAPDAQGLVLMDREDEAGEAPTGVADAGAAGSGRDMPATANARGDSSSSGGTVPDALNIDAEEASAAVADTGSAASGSVESAGDDAEQSDDSGSALEANTGPMPGIVAEDQDAVRGDGTTECPEGFPIKGNGRSRLYHVPEGSS